MKFCVAVCLPFLLNLQLVGAVCAKSIGDTLFFYVSPVNKIYYAESRVQPTYLNGKTASQVIDAWAKAHKNGSVEILAHRAADYMFVAQLLEVVQFSGVSSYAVNELNDETAKKYFPKEMEVLALKEKERAKLTATKGEEYELTEQDKAEILRKKEDLEALVCILYPLNKLYWYNNEEYPNIKQVEFSQAELGKILDQTKKTRLLIKVHDATSPATMSGFLLYLKDRDFTNYDFEPIRADETSVISQISK